MDITKPKDLPAFYYWDYFGMIIQFIEKHYLNLLSNEELHFLQIYQSLPFEGQCLLIRLGSRKPIWFHEKKIDYKEIPNLLSAFEILKQNKLIIELSELNDFSSDELLTELTKDELFQLCKEFPKEKSLPKSSTKEAFLQFFKGFKPDQIQDKICSLFPDFITLSYQKKFDFFQFLFFGSKSRDLTDFVVKDLGFRQFFEIKEDELIPYFTSREVALEKWQISNWNEQFYEASKSPLNPIEWIDSWNREILPLMKTISDLSIGSFERSVYLLARYLERMDLTDEALEIYEYGLSSKCLERRIRILTKLKRNQEAIQWARVGLELFHHPNDRHFYLDYLARIQPEKTIKQVTQKLKAAESIELVKDSSLSVEQQVANFYLKNGFQAEFTENTLWKNLIGLLTWEIIFNTQHHQFSHPFQLAPAEYRLEGFGLANLAYFHQKLELLSDKNKLWEHFETILQNHQGTLNPLIDWQYVDMDLLKIFLDRVSIKSLSSVLEQLWLNVATHSKGFPDLMVWNEETLFFVEVKSPNDQLSPIQYFWNEVLNSVGITSKIMRIKWLKN